jgi:hypothetical protein
MTRLTLGRTVHYRGKQGFQTLRAAVVTATNATLDRRGVEAGQVPDLASETHVHLNVHTPGSSVLFSEFNIPYAGDGVRDPEPGQWCWPELVDQTDTETASE